MPVIPGNQAYSPTLQSIANELKATPEFYNLLSGAPGYSTFPFLTLANEILCRILAEGMPWKWNRAIWSPFITVSLQQDYCSNLTDVGWLEDAWRVDINNSTSNSNGACKPVFLMNTVRDIPQTAIQAVPDDACFIPNYQAFMGLWQPNTAYSCGYGVSMTPRSPIQQFIDVNGNILFIDSSNLGLNIESPGFTGPTIIPPGFFPYGTSGSTQPAAPPDATPGTLVQDNTVVWTVANPQGFCLRVNPVPALNGLCWYIYCQYQMMPPQLLTMQQTLAPLPNQAIYLLRQGLRAKLKEVNGSKDAMQAYAEWEETLVKTVRAADRQQEEYALIPTTSLMGQNNPWMTPEGIGAAWPYGGSPYGY